MNNIPYIDILILGMIAVFIINRLRNTLGKKTGNEHDIVEKFSRNKVGLKESNPDKIHKENPAQNNLDEISEIFHENPSVAQELNKIKRRDPSFNVDKFLDGAKKAFEFIIQKYSDENISPLKKLLSNNIFKMFDGQIKKRAKKNENLDVSIIGIKNATITEAFLKSDSKASIKVEFSSEQVQVIKNMDGRIINGDGNQILSIVENWLFSKNLKNKDPNWILEKIEESK